MMHENKALILIIFYFILLLPIAVLNFQFEDMRKVQRISRLIPQYIDKIQVKNRKRNRK